MWTVTPMYETAFYSVDFMVNMLYRLKSFPMPVLIGCIWNLERLETYTLDKLTDCGHTNFYKNSPLVLGLWWMTVTLSYIKSGVRERSRNVYHLDIPNPRECIHNLSINLIYVAKCSQFSSLSTQHEILELVCSLRRFPVVLPDVCLLLNSGKNHRHASWTY